MSTANDNTDYHLWALCLLVLVAVIVLLVSVTIDESELRDTQRRIATLEQKCK